MTWTKVGDDWKGEIRVHSSLGPLETHWRITTNARNETVVSGGVSGVMTIVHLIITDPGVFAPLCSCTTECADCRGTGKDFGTAGKRVVEALMEFLEVR